jgi:hypothetical protein
MPSTYTPIATQTLSSTATSVTFSSIPSTYTDLRVVVTGITNPVLDVIGTFNGDTGNNYSRTFLEASASSVGSGRGTNQRAFLAFVPSSTTGQLSTHDFINYSNSTTFKTVLHRYSINSLSGAAVILWRNTNAITSIVYTASASTFNIGSCFTLYGIKAA